MILLPLLGCTDRLHGPDWEGGTYLEIRGPIQGGVIEESVHAAVIWTWVVDDTVGASAELVPFEPIVGGYRLGISHPPQTPVGNLAAPAELTLLGDAVVVLGSAVLLRGEGPPAIEVEPVPALAALLDGDTPSSSVRAAGHTVAGGWTHHRLGALGHTDAPSVAELPGWSGEPCALDQLATGLTLYVVPDDGCAWTATAPPGRTDVLEEIPIEVWP